MAGLLRVQDCQLRKDNSYWKGQTKLNQRYAGVLEWCEQPTLQQLLNRYETPMVWHRLTHSRNTWCRTCAHRIWTTKCWFRHTSSCTLAALNIVQRESKRLDGNEKPVQWCVAMEAELMKSATERGRAGLGHFDGMQSVERMMHGYYSYVFMYDSLYNGRCLNRNYEMNWCIWAWRSGRHSLHFQKCLIIMVIG